MALSPRQIGYIAAAALFFAAGWQIHGLIAQKRLEMALKQQETELVKQCNADKALTERIDHEQLQKISSLSRRVTELKRVHKTECVPVARPASSNNGTTGAGHAGADAVAFESLIDYAALAEKHRIQLLGCQDFVRSLR